MPAFIGALIQFGYHGILQTVDDSNSCFVIANYLLHFWMTLKGADPEICHGGLNFGRFFGIKMKKKCACKL